MALLCAPMTLAGSTPATRLDIEAPAQEKSGAGFVLMVSLQRG